VKKFLKSRLGAWIVAALVTLPLVQFKRMHDSNAYCRMQETTVLIQTPSGQGSGVVVERVNEQGRTRVFVWTVNHVVNDVTETKVVKNIRTEGHRAGQAEFTAKVIGRDPKRDLALLWLDAPAGYFRATEFAPSEPIKIGTPLVLVGNVAGKDFEDSVSLGIMSGVGYTPGEWTLTDQAALAGFLGCSGGPIFQQGSSDVVGLTVATIRGSGFMQFVPVRVIEDFANGAVLHWAVRGNWCPGDDLLRGLNAREVQAKTFSVN
jgi:S1-C subfamily serine protease